MNRKFNDVVNQIDKSERDVDKVLHAARLERHEGAPRYLSAEQKMTLLLSAMALVAFIAFWLPLFFCGRR